MAAFRVLIIFFAASDAFFCGADITAAKGMASGTLYPILNRFEADGLLKSKWEKQHPEDLGHPRRRFYKITGNGITVAQKAIADLGLK